MKNTVSISTKESKSTDRLAFSNCCAPVHSVVYHEDCLKGLNGFSDNHFDLAVVDPPYFDGPNKLGYYGGRKSKTGVFREEFEKVGTWNVPGYDYYNELCRVSKNQIIWGINYFEFAGEVSGRIIWDKCNDNSSFSKCEIASASQITTVQQFRFMWNGMMQGKGIKDGHIQQGNKQLNEKRIHPTQKPIALYLWLFDRFAKAGDLILDTHVGSGSSRIAADKAGLNYVGFEIDETYFNAQEKRFNQYRQQLKLF